MVTEGMAILQPDFSLQINHFNDMLSSFAQEIFIEGLLHIGLGDTEVSRVSIFSSFIDPTF
jgi:hypothetical protein